MLPYSWYNAHLDDGTVLEKKMDDQSMDILAGGSIPKEDTFVDHTPHTSRPIPGQLKNMLATPTSVTPFFMTGGKDPAMLEGASEKVVHDVKDFKSNEPADQLRSNRVMSKPYHHKPNSGYPYPIYGWATMTTKDMFDAAGIKDMAEDVYASEHNGVPMTHHVFEPEQYVRSRLKPAMKADPMDMHKLAIMDYLAGNVDRHYGNLLVDPSRIKDNLKAIDHERNFQYVQKSGFGRDFDLPFDYYSRGALTSLEPSRPLSPEHDRDLANWWNQHKDKVKDMMVANAASVHNKKLRDYIISNFMRRWAALSSWAAEDEPHNYRIDHLFSPDFKRQVPNSNMSDQYMDVDKYLTENERRDPKAFMHQLAQTIRKQPDAALMLSGVIQKVSRNMAPNDIATIVLNHNDNLNWDVVRDLIMHQPKQKQGDILRAVKQQIDENPNPAKPRLPFVDLMVERINKGQDPFKTEKI